MTATPLQQLITLAHAFLAQTPPTGPECNRTATADEKTSLLQTVMAHASAVHDCGASSYAGKTLQRVAFWVDAADIVHVKMFFAEDIPALSLMYILTQHVAQDWPNRARYLDSLRGKTLSLQLV